MLTRSFLCALFLLCVPGQPLLAQDAPPPSLESKLKALTKGFRGEVGVYVKNLKTGEETALAADQPAPTASLIKVPIMAALFERIAAGALQYRQSLTFTRDRVYSKGDLSGNFVEGAKVSLAKLVTLMITFSDNTASLWCQELAGTGTGINRWLAANGFEVTRVNSRTEGREEAKKRFGWGQTTPREMARLFEMIAKGQAVDAGASEEMYRALTRIHWDGEALSAIPPTVQVASKQGAVSASRSEVLLVNAPHGDYVLAVITQKQEDKTWKHDNEGYVLIRSLSAAVWNHYEPDHPWAAAEPSDPWK